MERRRFALRDLLLGVTLIGVGFGCVMVPVSSGRYGMAVVTFKFIVFAAILLYCIHRQEQ